MVPRKENTASKITFIILFVLVIALAFKVASSFLMAIVVGALLSLALRPLQKKISSKKISHKLSAYLVFFMLLAVVVVPLGFFIKSLIEQAVSFRYSIHFSDISYGSITRSVSKLPFIGSIISDPVQLESQIKTWIIEMGTWVSSFALEFASKVPSFLFQVFFVLLSCLFFLLDGEKLFGFLNDRVNLRDDIRTSLIKSFNKSSKSVIWATFLASLSQSVVIFLGFITLSVPAAFLASGATFFFAFIPIIGATPVWISAAIYLYLKGSIVKCVLMIVFGLIAGLIDNVVRIVVLKGVKGSKKSVGMHPMISLVAVLGGLQVFGFFGVLIGPVIAALLISMLEVWPSVYK